MNRQFGILYRQFLFRIADLETLSPDARGDATRLLGQFAALLVFITVSLAMPAIIVAGRPGEVPKAESWISAMGSVHFLIALTMLVVGVFSVLSWEHTLPGRLDAVVLSPLPVSTRALLAAKFSSVATALLLTVLLLHSMLGLTWPIILARDRAVVRLPAFTFAPAAPPASTHDLKPLLDQALAGALDGGALSPGLGAGLVIGVVARGERLVQPYGAAHADSIFEIGSITKTFTGLLAAHMAARGKLQLNEPVRQLLPRGLAAPTDGAEITVSDLATHHSGLPALPSNFFPVDRSNPYADYTVDKLYAYLRERGLAKPEDTLYGYSNLGAGLLGQALAERGGAPYGDLVRDSITSPLGMADTVIELTPAQRERFLQGYDEHHHAVHEWNLDALAGAGALRSTAGDLLTYLEANLHPERYPQLATAFVTTQHIREHTRGGTQIGLAWMFDTETASYRHGGATAGFASFAFFIPSRDCAAVVLMNGGPSLTFNPSLIGEHLRQRLAGEPAVSLDTVAVAAGRGVLRSFAAYWFTMIASAWFVWCVVVTAQGLLVRTLPRGFYVRVSGYVQILAFAVAVGLFFLQPGLGGLDELSARGLWRAIRYLPSYWFLALHQQINGSLHPALEPLALRAWLGLIALSLGCCAAYVLPFSRVMHEMIETPDIAPAVRSWRWLPRFATSFETAVGHFGIRTLLRSKQHRLTLALYWGAAFAYTSLILKDPYTRRALADAGGGNPWAHASVALWSASIVTLVLAIVGTRVVFSIPVDIRANWTFRGARARTGGETVRAARGPLWVLAAGPAWLMWAAPCLTLWPSWQTVGHLVILLLVAAIVCDASLAGFGKIPFACSYLPGKSRVHLAMLGAVGLLLVTLWAVTVERDILKRLDRTMIAMVALGLAAVLARWAANRSVDQLDQWQFEQTEPPAVQRLGLGPG